MMTHPGTGGRAAASSAVRSARGQFSLPGGGLFDFIGGSMVNRHRAALLIPHHGTSSVGGTAT